MSTSNRATAAIFDMDGVLVDSEPIHFEAARRLLAPAGVTITAEMSRRFVGRPVVDFLVEAIEHFRLPGTLAEYRARYDEQFFELLTRPLPAREGAAWLIDELHGRGCGVGLASTSGKAWIDAMLRAIGLEDKFDTIIGGDMVAQVKPAPDVYLLAAERLGRTLASCVAVEDSPTGVQAAHAAGMRVVGLVTRHVHPEALRQADVLIDTLRDFPMSLMARSGRGGPAIPPKPGESA